MGGWDVGMGDWERALVRGRWTWLIGIAYRAKMRGKGAPKKKRTKTEKRKR